MNHFVKITVERGEGRQSFSTTAHDFNGKSTDCDELQAVVAQAVMEWGNAKSAAKAGPD